MRTFALVALGMVTAGIAGAAAVWASMALMEIDVEPQPPEVLRSLSAVGGVLAGVCGGLASIVRWGRRSRDDLFTGFAALALGIVGVAVINPGLIFAPLFLLMAPLQGLAALLGGLLALAALWGVLWVAGVRDATPAGQLGQYAGTVEQGGAGPSP